MTMTAPGCVPPPMEVDRNGLEVLDRHECLRLLTSATLGRIGFTSGALPTVLPVDYRLDGDRVLVRTCRGSRLDTALQNAVVAFEVDDIGPASRLGWSVAVIGVATEIGDPGPAHDASQEPMARWAPPGDQVVLAISTEIVSGRRVTAESRLRGR